MEPKRTHGRLFLLTHLSLCVFVGGCGPTGRVDPQDLAGRTVHLSISEDRDLLPPLPSTFPTLTLALHEGLPEPELAELLGLELNDLKLELERLQELGLVQRGPEGYLPRFFVADRRDSRKVLQHARSTGRLLAEETLAHWDSLEAVFCSMAISTAYSLQDLGLLLVGGEILDAGMLAALLDGVRLEKVQGSLGRPQAPAPLAYDLWAVEGERDLLGRYWVSSIDLPKGPWRLLTFGIASGGRDRLQPIPSMEVQVHDLVQRREGGTAIFFSQALSVPILTQRDSRLWKGATERLSSALLRRLQNHGPDIPRLFNSLRSGRYGEPAFRGFLVWYHRLAVTSAIEELASRGAFHRPRGGFQSVILYQDAPEQVPVTY